MEQNAHYCQSLFPRDQNFSSP